MGGGLEERSDGIESLGPTILSNCHAEVASGRRVGLELVSSGPVVSATGWPTRVPAGRPQEATDATRTRQRQQVDLIKVNDAVALTVYRAVAPEAKNMGLWFAGDVPEEVGPLAPVHAGQRSIQHIRDPLLVCFTDDAIELDRCFGKDGWSESDKQWGRTGHASSSALIGALRGSANLITRTLTVEEAETYVESAAHVAVPRWRTLPQSVRDDRTAYVRRKLSQPASERASERVWRRTQ